MRSTVDKIVEVSRAVVTERCYGESKRRAAIDQGRTFTVVTADGLVTACNRGFRVVVERLRARATVDFTAVWRALAKRCPERAGRRVRSVVCRPWLAVMAVAVPVVAPGGTVARS